MVFNNGDRNVRRRIDEDKIVNVRRLMCCGLNDNYYFTIDKVGVSNFFKVIVFRKIIFFIYHSYSFKPSALIKHLTYFQVFIDFCVRQTDFSQNSLLLQLQSVDALKTKGARALAEVY